MLKEIVAWFSGKKPAPPIEPAAAPPAYWRCLGCMKTWVAAKIPATSFASDYMRVPPPSNPPGPWHDLWMPLVIDGIDYGSWKLCGPIRRGRPVGREYLDALDEAIMRDRLTGGAS